MRVVRVALSVALSVALFVVHVVPVALWMGVVLRLVFRRAVDWYGTIMED